MENREVLNKVPKKTAMRPAMNWFLFGFVVSLLPLILFAAGVDSPMGPLGAIVRGLASPAGFLYELFLRREFLLHDGSRYQVGPILLVAVVNGSICSGIYFLDVIISKRTNPHAHK